MVGIGDTLRVDYMEGEPQYSGCVGTVEFIDGIGQIHGTWSGCALIPEIDSFTILKKHKIVEDDGEISTL